MIAPLFEEPRFEVINRSEHVVHVSAYWRNEKKDLGIIQPSSSLEFSLSDEAAMTFSARYPDGRAIDSEEIYFTGGTRIIATITETSFNVKYDHETLH